MSKDRPCEHRRYSVDTATGEGRCMSCGAEGRMRFVVGDPVADELERWQKIAVDTIDEPSLLRFTLAIERASRARCQYCDDTGHVHNQTGEWRGVCCCPAGTEQKAAALDDCK